LFIANSGESLESNGSIGEYTTSGTPVNPALVSGLDYPNSIALSGDRLFVTNSYGGTVGEYTTSGETVNPSLISGLSFPTAVALSEDNLLVGNLMPSGRGGRIGEYTILGEPLNPALISGISGPFGIAEAPQTVPDASSSSSLLLFAIITVFAGRRLLHRIGVTRAAFFARI